MGRTVRFRSSDKEGAVIRPAISQTRLSGKVAKIFPRAFHPCKALPKCQWQKRSICTFEEGKWISGAKDSSRQFVTPVVCIHLVHTNDLIGVSARVDWHSRCLHPY